MSFHSFFENHRYNISGGFACARCRSNPLTGIRVKGLKDECHSLASVRLVHLPSYLDYYICLGASFQHIQRAFHKGCPTCLAHGNIVFRSTHRHGFQLLLAVFKTIAAVCKHLPDKAYNTFEFRVLLKCELIIGN